MNLNIEYYNMAGAMEDYAEFNEKITIAPRMTKKINIKAYEENRNYVYETSKDTYNVTRFKVKYKYIGCTKTNTQGSITQSFQGQNSKDVADKDAICDVVERMPSFPGGTAALMQYLSSHIRFVPTAEENGIQGRVITTFVVCKDGSISNVEVTKSVDPSLDREAVRVVKSMPNWNPGVDKDGNYVNVKYTLPLTFRLQ